MSQKEKTHLYTLDLLRGVAALSVCLMHFTGSVLPKLKVPLAAILFSWGWLGVEIFFVISGFIIPYVLLKSNYNLQGFGNFIGKRFVRICPPSYVALTLVILQYLFIDHFFHPAKSWSGSLSMGQISHHLFYTIPFTNYEWINGVFWTLAVEFQFYLFIGLLFPLMFRSQYHFIGLSLLTLCLYYMPFSDKLQFFHYSSLFLMGGLTMLFFEKRVSTAIFLITLLAFGLCCYAQLGLLPTLFGVGTSLVIAFVKIKNKVSTFLGNISYSLYLNHVLIGSTLEVVLSKIINPQTAAMKLTLLAFCVAATIACSYLFYKTVELYFVNLANKLFSSRTKSTRKVEKASEVVL